MMKQVLMFGVVMLALCFAGCGGSAGDSGERAMAKDVLEAFAEGNVADIVEMFTPEAKDELLLHFDGWVQSLVDASKEAREQELKSFNDSMSWDVDWKKVEDADVLKGYDSDAKINARKSSWREYSSPHRIKNFKEHMDDMRLVGYSRSFDSPAGDWGTASIAFQNKWGAGLNVNLVQREGRWYVAGLTPIGFQFQSKEETDAARKAG